MLYFELIDRPLASEADDRHGRISGDAALVSPRIAVADIADALRHLPREEFDTALRQKYFPIATRPGHKLYAACGAQAAARAQGRGLTVVADVPVGDFHAALWATHRASLLRDATFWLARSRPVFSARQRFTPNQLGGLLLGAFAVAAAIWLVPAGWLTAGLSLFAALFFLSIIALRLLCFLPRGLRGAPAPTPLAPEQLPTYTVLVPLFRETAVLDRLLPALGRLRYPSDRLDIKLILEEGDAPMHAALAAWDLPEHFETIVVPAGSPQTKPRALNYALAFARGELLTIYDAEDVPEPRQLQDAAEIFASAPPELACLQAELTFYNPNENWLARQFTIEYASLFGIMLPALASHGLPVLLGGTSNHFRVAALREAGGWDPFNVTEDADLGLRLARMGFETATFAALTYEEANVQLRNWLRQRTRWLKGFLITWLVHMRQPLALWRELGTAGFLTAQAATIGVFGSALLHPICLAIMLWVFLAEPPRANPTWAQAALVGLSLLVLASGYAVTIAIGWRALRHRGFAGWGFSLVTLPIYWLLISFAAWVALREFAVAPFRWNKTQHGLSRIGRRK